MKSRSSKLSWSSLRTFLHRESTVLPNVEQYELTCPHRQESPALALIDSDSNSAPTLLSSEEPQKDNDHARKWRAVVSRLCRSTRWRLKVPSLVTATPPIVLPPSTSLIPSDVPCKHTLYPSAPSRQLSPSQRATNRSPQGRRLAIDYGDLSCDLAWRSLVCAIQLQEGMNPDQPQKQRQARAIRSPRPVTPRTTICTTEDCLVRRIHRLDFQRDLEALPTIPHSFV